MKNPADEVGHDAPPGGLGKPAGEVGMMYHLEGSIQVFTGHSGQVLTRYAAYKNLKNK